ncbi:MULTISPECIES: hypothetical protein [unclassified Caballeronia]|uniref:hypothetical protein n=1 Tax=unclassified Caballeronia TaxID=2646786 RepID=UPI00285C1A8F|nr:MULTISPECIES: hypothetical protein [unclassified Caballeronia]MDR5739183.1 hypothetical protein [Caballeronia sp. LZ016]MDR5807671.1 hypothetical protein [Caballeronia sp. LZ019]
MGAGHAHHRCARRRAPSELDRGRAAGAQDRFTLDAAGQLVARTDALNQHTRYIRDAQGRVVERLDAAGRKVAFEYDAYGRLTALVNENGERYGFGYDAGDRLIEQINLDGQRQQTDYDARGGVTATRWAAGTSAQIEHRYLRDAVGRLTRRESLRLREMKWIIACTTNGR